MFSVTAERTWTTFNFTKQKLLKRLFLCLYVACPARAVSLVTASRQWLFYRVLTLDFFTKKIRGARLPPFAFTRLSRQV